MSQKTKIKTKIPLAIKISPDINDGQIDEMAQIFLKYNKSWNK